MNYEIGQIAEGKVTGIQPYGAFVSLDPHTTGLIHISEISDGYVKDIQQFVQIGDTVKVKIIDYDEKSHQARLSLKALSHRRAAGSWRSGSRKASLPPMKIGFQTIRDHMDQWIKEAKEEMK